MAQPPPPAAAPLRPELEREVWLACAGPYARLPATGSRVYYFPRGHADQCRGAHLPDQPEDVALPCTVSAVELFYHAATDDPYASITLLPNDGRGQAQPSDHQANPTGGRSAAYFVKDISSVYDKEAFTIPKDCADSLLPSINHNNEKQTLDLLDVQRKELQFGHSGDDQLTTGWGQYFRNKQLMLRLDAVVFIRGANDQLLIGSRRSLFSEHHAREQVQDVMGAAAARVAGGPFRVTYYPRQGWDFVVPREEVDAADARNIDWQPGMKVRMVCPVDDHELESSRAQRRNSYEGIVTAVNNTTWCKLEINWRTGWRSPKPWIGDIPRRQVNVWRVELHGDPSPGNKRKKSQSPNFAAGHPSSKSKVPHLMPRATTAQYMAGSPIAAGMQGGRQGSLTDVLSSSSTPGSETLFGAEMAPTSAVSTQNIASSSSSTARSIKLFSVKMAPGVAPVDGTPKDDNPAKNPTAKDGDQNPDESA